MTVEGKEKQRSKAIDEVVPSTKAQEGLGNAADVLTCSWLRSFRPFRGILLDVRARAPYYVSDWTDAWNYRVVPATLLIFFSKCVPM